jgi:hypothetical protein
MLHAIASDPDAARIVFVEALGAGERMRTVRMEAFERFERRVAEYMASLPEDSLTLDIPVSAVAGALRHIVARHLRNHAEDRLPERIDDGLAWLDCYRRATGAQPWSSSDRALLEQAPAPPPSEPAQVLDAPRLPRGTHRLPASLVAAASARACSMPPRP